MSVDERDLEVGSATRVGSAGCLGVLVLLAAAVPATVAVAALIGVGLARQMPGVPAVAGGLVLVLLPVLGLASLLAPAGRRAGAVGGSAWFWSLTVLLVFPFYFPGERTDAVRAGLSHLTSPIGADAPQLVDVGLRLVALLGSEPERLAGAKPVLVEEEPAVEATARTERADEEPRGDVVIPYQGEGEIMRVAVFFDGPRYGEEFQMIFDTGATYTTLDRASLEQLELEISRDAPHATLRTANGEVDAPLVLVDAVWLGDAVVEWVTIAVCDLCASEGISGLLGLNVSRQFKVGLDHSAREIQLQAREDAEDRKLDIAQWLDLSSHVRRWQDGSVEVEVVGRNLAPVAIRDVAAQIDCPGGRFEVLLERIPAEETASVEMSLPRNTDCSEYVLELESASWESDRF